LSQPRGLTHTVGYHPFSLQNIVSILFL
jgi:hypothetical protein